MAIPNSYIPAEWRNTTPVDRTQGMIGVGFNLGDGTIVRLALSGDSARYLSETILDYLKTSQSMEATFLDDRSANE